MNECLHGPGCFQCRLESEPRETCSHGVPRSGRACERCTEERYASLPGRVVTADEAAFLTRYGFTHGFDDDNPDLEQYSHVCWPVLAGNGALCGSPRLWFSGGGWLVPRADGSVDPLDSHVACDGCFVRLGFLRAYPVDSFERMKIACDHARLAGDLVSAVVDYLYILDHPSEAPLSRRHTVDGALACLRGAAEPYLSRVAPSAPSPLVESTS